MYRKSHETNRALLTRPPRIDASAEIGIGDVVRIDVVHSVASSATRHR
jgi:hypothetical protein